MNKVFISSVISGYESYRQAAKEAVELMDHRPVMSENFGARPYPSEVACITEVEQSDIYLLILGGKYGFETDEGISVTQAEFRAAKAANRNILAFVQRCEMEPRQAEFKGEVEAYQDGFFRAAFDSPVQLKDECIRAMRQLESMSQAISEGDFQKRIDKVITALDDSWADEPALVAVFLPQPERIVDIVKLEDDLDGMFRKLCDAGLAKLRDGYEAIGKADWTGLKTGRYQLACFADGLVALATNPTLKNGNTFSSNFAPPSHIQQVAIGFSELINTNSGYIHIGVRNMGTAHVAEFPGGSSFSLKMFGEDQAGFNRLFVPLTKGIYQEWIEQCVNRMKRIFPYGNN